MVPSTRSQWLVRVPSTFCTLVLLHPFTLSFGNPRHTLPYKSDRGPYTSMKINPFVSFEKKTFNTHTDHLLEMTSTNPPHSKTILLYYFAIILSRKKIIESHFFQFRFFPFKQSLANFESDPSRATSSSPPPPPPPRLQQFPFPAKTKNS